MALLVANTQPDLGDHQPRRQRGREHRSAGARARGAPHRQGDRRAALRVGLAAALAQGHRHHRGDPREHSAPCRFFDSDALVQEPIPRQGDKIHPNEAGRRDLGRGLLDLAASAARPAEPVAEAARSRAHGSSARAARDILSKSKPKEREGSPGPGSLSERRGDSPVHGSVSSLRRSSPYSAGLMGG